MNQARLGDQTDRVLAGKEIRRAEPVGNDRHSPQLGIVQARQIAIAGRQQHVGRLDDDQQLLAQGRPRADAQLP